MKTKKLFGFFVFALVALALTGWSCGNGYAVNNNEPDTANQPQTYSNSDWGVSFQYPAGWQYREYRETVDGREEVTLAFSSRALPETLPPEPVFPVTVFRDARIMDDVAAGYTSVVSNENVMLGGKTAKKIIYFSNMLEQNDTVYLVPLRSGTLKFFALQEADYPAVSEAMISTVTETE